MARTRLHSESHHSVDRREGIDTIPARSVQGPNERGEENRPIDVALGARVRPSVKAAEPIGVDDVELNGDTLDRKSRLQSMRRAIIR